MKILRNIRNISSGTKQGERRVGRGGADSRVTRQPGCWNNNNAATAAVMCWDKLIILSDILIAGFIRRRSILWVWSLHAQTLRLYQVQACQHLSCLIALAFKTLPGERGSGWCRGGLDSIALILRTKIKCVAPKLLKVLYSSKSKFPASQVICHAVMGEMRNAIKAGGNTIWIDFSGSASSGRMKR